MKPSGTVFDVIICGAGVIGVSVALELRNRGAEVLLVDAREPGQEASHAAAGMLSAGDPETPRQLRAIADASTRLYPEYLASLEPYSQANADYREGTLLIREENEAAELEQIGLRQVTNEELRELEPALSIPGRVAFWLDDASVDPRGLMQALVAAAKARGVHLAHGSAVTEIEVAGDRVTGARTARAHYAAKAVVNCAGAWAGEISPTALPTVPVKGHMLDVIAPPELLRLVVRSPEVYIVPRSGGRVLIGATLEHAGFNKEIVPETIQRLHQAAANLVPALGEARIHEVWTGLRPGTPDGLPIMGSTSIGNYFVATGHYRNGILLAPVTAKIMAALLAGEHPGFDLAPFSPARFRSVT